jgi:Glyoxalase/Bleomycin resistance protein/Dioxygenase superfamily
VRPIWQIGIVVADIDAASAELGHALGLEFPAPVERAFGGHRLRVAIAKQGPPYFELLEGEPGGPWDGHSASRLDHVSYWVDDLCAERERLEAERCPIFLDSDTVGLPANYHLLPASDIRVEPLRSSFKQAIRDLWGIDDLDSAWRLGSPWQLGFMVDDIEASRGELARVLGVDWTPVQSRGEGAVSVCMTMQGLPYLELVQARVGSNLAWRPSPKFDHLAYWVEDLAAESDRLEAVGVPCVQEFRPEIRFHHAPKSGVRLELIAASYRDTIRSLWGLEDLG